MQCPKNILGLQAIRKLFSTFLNYKRIPGVVLATVKIPKIEFPKIPPSFTTQYPIKWGREMEEVKETIETLLKENIIEPAQSFSYISRI